VLADEPGAEMKVAKSALDTAVGVAGMMGGPAGWAISGYYSIMDAAGWPAPQSPYAYPTLPAIQNLVSSKDK
jgi:hypothetical protein